MRKSIAFTIQGLILTVSSSSIALASEQKGWREWKGQLPHTISCVNGILTWKQTSTARMVVPSEQWSNFQTTAEVGVTSSVTGNRISAGVGAQSISLKLDGNTLCESWKFDKPTPGFLVNRIRRLNIFT